MNPRTDFEECEPQTARAFFELFRRCGDEFKFGVDQRGTAESELRATIVPSDHSHDDQTSVLVAGIEMPDEFERVVNKMQDIGFNLIDKESGTNKSEEIGEYNYQMTAAVADESGDWDTPHLVVYGSLSPEIEESIYAAFGARINMASVRNHYLVWGEQLGERPREELATAIQHSNAFFKDEQRDRVSDARTADLI